jgi:hypothetical protein
MKVERKIVPLSPKGQRVKDLEAKKTAGETTKEALARIEAKLDLLLSR